MATSMDTAAASRALRLAPWLIMGLGAMFALARRGSDEGAPEGLLLPAMASLFALLIAQVAVSLRRWPSRRSGLTALLLGLILWGVGSAVLNGGPSADARSFPSPGETLFLAAGVAFAAFLLLDVDRRSAMDAAAWTDALILCSGGGVIVACGLIPVVAAIGESGGALFVALAFPVIDALLALLVIGQIAQHARAVSPRNIQLAVGFVLLAVADTSLSVSAHAGTYHLPIWLDLVWSAALTLIVSGGCLPRDLPRASRRESPTFVVLFFAGLSLVVLVALAARPPGPLGPYLAIPATVTLVAVGARLVLALRASRHATESYRLARTDDLTGLPNRRALLRALDERLASGSPVSLLLFDLDGFKEVNDSLGHGAGDEVLQAVAARLQEATPATRYLARLGGDEFALITPSVTEDRCLADAHEIRTILARPVQVAGLTWTIHASVGVGTSMRPGTTASDLLRQADVAMYEAKRTRAGATVYDVARDVFSRDRLQLADELRRGIDAGELELWYQPQLDARTLEVVSVEALARWHHPSEGMVAPAVFLPVARRSGLMPALSLTVAHLVVQQAIRWQHSGGPQHIAMNVAPPELLRGPLLSVLYELLDTSGLPSGAIILEVTEDSFLNDPDRARELLIEAQHRGLDTSIDDFGTGFSSLAYLRDLPVSELKIDRSFVHDVVTNTRSRLILESTVRMAEALGLRTVAEGVEDVATHDLLDLIGVDRVQGFLYARPMRAPDLELWLRSHEEQRLPAATGT